MSAVVPAVVPNWRRGERSLIALDEMDLRPYGPYSSQDDRSRIVSCGAQFCAVVTTAAGSTRNIWEALKRLNTTHAHQKT